MKTAETILTEIANRNSYNTWDEYMYDAHSYSQINATKEAMHEFAAQQTTALREELRLMTEDRNRASIVWGLEYGNTLQLKDQVNELRADLDKARGELSRYQKVKAVKDDSGHWHIIPADLLKQFLKDCDNEDMSDSGEFDKKYGKYRTGGDVNNIELYARITNP